MKRVRVTALCKAYYSSYIEVPDDLTKEEIEDYANDHLDELIVHDLAFLEDIPYTAEVYDE